MGHSFLTGPGSLTRIGLGVSPDDLAVIMANAGSGVANFTYLTDIDATVVATHQLTPTIPGYMFVPCRAPFTVLSITGTATGALSGSVGTNSPNYTNAIASLSASVTTTYLNAGVGSTFYAAPNASLVGQSLPLFINVTVAPTGVTACKIRIGIQGYWTPTSF